MRKKNRLSGVIFIGVIVLLLLVSWLAGDLPARRAARIQPVEVLREEA